MADGCRDRHELLTGKSHEIIETTKSGDVDALKALVDRYKQEGRLSRAFRAYDGTTWQAVHYACQRDDPALVRVFLEADPEVIQTWTYEGISPLMVAAGEGCAEVVQLLLELLIDGDLKATTMDGMNALYYAVTNPDPVKAERVASLLLNKCSSPDVMQLRHEAECVPYAMLRQKSLDLLNLFLRFGLTTTYQTQEPVFWPDEFHEGLPSESYPPANLAAYCVHLDWSDGLQTIIDWHRKRLSGELAPGMSSSYPLTDGSTPLTDLLNYRDTDGLTYSAWALSLLLGRLDCFRLMLDAGLTMMDYCHCAMDCDGDELRYYFPLALALSQDVSQRKEFVNCLVKLQSSEAFEEEFVQFLSSDSAEPDGGFHRWIERFVHPVYAIVNFGYYASANTLATYLAVLRECGFGFDFDLIPNYDIGDSRVDWHNTASFLLHTMLDSPLHERSAMTLFFDLVCRHNELTIGPEAVVLSLPANCSDLREEFTSLPENATGPDFTLVVLLSLSLMPAEWIRLVYENLMVTSNDRLRCFIRTGEPRGDDSRVLEYPFPCPADVLMFLIKGFQVVLSDSPVLCNPFDGHLPIALTFLGSRDRANHIRAALAEADTETRQRYRQHLPDSEVDSLMSLCRAEIRRCLGPARLLRDPLVPLDAETETSEWELSSIDLLPGLPNPIKNYLKYADDVQAYAAEWLRVESGVTD